MSEILIFHAGEVFPLDKHYREYRYGAIVRKLNRKGFSVTRFALTLNHFSKTLRFTETTYRQISELYGVFFLHGGYYSKNISIRRVLVYIRSALELLRVLRAKDLSDVCGAIISIPSIEMAWLAALYCKCCGIPYVFDARDNWPDKFYSNGSGAMVFLVKFLATPYRWMVRYVAKNAVSITAVSESYLDWGVRLARRESRPDDMVFPLGYRPVAPGVGFAESLPSGFRDRLELSASLNCIYVGQFEESYDIETIIKVANVFAETSQDVNFILCGRGSKWQEAADASANLTNVYLTGFIGSETISEAMDKCDVGLVAYGATAEQTLPNKPFEYMSSGLILVSSLRTELDQIIESYDIGVKYEAGDVSSLVRCLSELTASAETRKGMKERSINLFKEKFCSEILYEDMALHCLEVFARPTEV